MDAVWIDTLIRFKQAGHIPKRTLRMALTCGEETSWAFNGARWLAQNRPDLLAAEFALNEGGGERTDGKGRLLIAHVHAGEKAVANYRIETTNPGGHSSTPVPDNAIYELAGALTRISAYEFPVQLNDTTRAYFRIAGTARGDAMGRAMVAIAAGTADAAAMAMVDSDKTYHAMLRTTCVATLLDGGHANNALPQRAGANINCRIFPGGSAAQVRDRLVRLISDPGVRVIQAEDRGPPAVPPPLDPTVMKPAEALLARYHPGVPLAPLMSTFATDGIFLEAIGIPVYGPAGIYNDPDGNGTHGLNERAEIKAVYDGRDYLYDLIKAYTG